MDEYIKRTDEVKIAEKYGLANSSVLGRHTGLADCIASEILSLPAADVAPVQKWINIKDRLPEPEQEVFVCVKSKISNYSYVCCAMHVPENWYRQSSDFCWDFEC